LLLLLLLLLLQAYVYLSSIAVKDGKVFALFVRSPSRVSSESSSVRRLESHSCSDYTMPAVSSIQLLVYGVRADGLQLTLVV
jgi:hypothetical protein